MHLELITKQVANLSRAVGGYIRNEIKNVSKSRITDKGVNNFVTYVDRKSEERLVTELLKILPEAGVIAEENSDYPRKDRYNWIIDPLDGTTNFIHGVPPFSVSIALMEREEVVVGVIYEINLQECYYTWKEGGSYLNGYPIRCTRVKTLKDSLVATGFPYSDFSRLEGYLGLFTELMKSSHGIRRLGSAAVDLAYLACGRYDAFFEYGLNPWDVAAGALLIQESGGHVFDFTGGKNYIFGKELAATNGALDEELLPLVRKYFQKTS